MTERTIIRAIDTGPRPKPDVTVDGIFAERDFRYGRIKYLTTDYGVGRMLEQYGEYVEGEVSLLRKLVRPGHTVVSAGGNIGVHLIPLSLIVGLGRVITFEPQPFIREKLLLPNLQMNACPNVEVYGWALGADAGIAYFPELNYSAPNNFGGMELRDAGQVAVAVAPLDDMRLSRIDMLMLDVEGYEEQALRGARETIARCRPYLYVEIDREAVREKLLHFIQDELGYELLFHTPRIYNPDNWDRNPDNPYGNMCSVMCLGIPR